MMRPSLPTQNPTLSGWLSSRPQSLHIFDFGASSIACGRLRGLQPRPLLSFPRRNCLHLPAPHLLAPVPAPAPAPVPTILSSLVLTILALSPGSGFSSSFGSTTPPTCSSMRWPVL